MTRPVAVDAAPLVSLDRVTKYYGHVAALDDIDFVLGRGELVALLGQNGAGKSTLVGVLSGFLTADTGLVTRNPRVWRRDHRSLGFAPQQTGVYPQLTVERNLAFFGEYSGLKRKELRSRIDVVATATGIANLLHRPAYEMSGGEQRRLHTAIALIADPTLLILDEPTVGADIEGRQAMLELVQDCADRGATVLYSTHYLGEVDALRGEVAILHRGRLLARKELSLIKELAGGTIVELQLARPVDAVPSDLVGRDSVQSIDVATDSRTLRATVTDAGLALSGLLHWLVTQTIDIVSVRVIGPSLESAFLSLTSEQYEEGFDA